MRTARRVAALATTAALAVGACSSGSSATVVKLDGSPRTPDVEGVVLQASAAGVTLDGNRSYDVSKRLISFSTYNRKVVPLASTKGAYVQAGVDGDTIVWISKVGPVGADNTVQYQGDLVEARGRKLIFRDGTVLTLAAGLTAPAQPEGPAYAVIDAKKHVVQGATFAPPRSKN